MPEMRYVPAFALAGIEISNGTAAFSPVRFKPKVDLGALYRHSGCPSILSSSDPLNGLEEWFVTVTDTRAVWAFSE